LVKSTSHTASQSVSEI